MDARGATRGWAAAGDGPTPGGGAAWARAAKGSTLSGLRDRVLTLSGASGRARQRWVAKATESESEPMKAEDWRRIVAEVWESGESRWVLQRIRERPLATDHVVAFKAVLLLHRVLQQGPPEVVSHGAMTNEVLEGLATHWGTKCRSTQASPLRHFIQAVAEYAKVLLAKMELMEERDTGRGRFDGNIAVFDRSRKETSDMLQSLAVLLDFAEKLMPFALHLVAPSAEMWRMDTYHYIRLYISAIVAVVEEAWLLLCAVSLFVKDLLCQVHVARKIEQHGRARRSQAPGLASPWLQLALHLLAARPRFVWFHTSVCDFVAHCHQLRCAGFIELAPHIPTVPQSLLNLFADLGELVRSQAVDVKGTAAQREGALASLSTTAGSTPQATESSHTDLAPGGHAFKRSPETGSAAPPRKDVPDAHVADRQAGTWEPSPCVLDALRTVDSIQNAPKRFAGHEQQDGSATNPAGGHAAGSSVTVHASGSVVAPARSGSSALDSSKAGEVPDAAGAPPPVDERGGRTCKASRRNLSAPATGRQASSSAGQVGRGSLRCRQRSREVCHAGKQSNRLGQPRARQSAAKAQPPDVYMLLDDDPDADEDMTRCVGANLQEGGSVSSTARQPKRSMSPVFHHVGHSEPTRPSAVAALIGATGGGPVKNTGITRPPSCPWSEELDKASEQAPDVKVRKEDMSPWPPPLQVGPCGSWPPILDSKLPSRPAFPVPVYQPLPPPSWATAICQSNNTRSESHPHALFVAPLWHAESQPLAPADGAQAQSANRESAQAAVGEHAFQQGPGLSCTALPLNPFDLTATQLQRAVLRKDSRAGLNGGGGTPTHAEERPAGGSLVCPPVAGTRPSPATHGRSVFPGDAVDVLRQAHVNPDGQPHMRPPQQIPVQPQQSVAPGSLVVPVGTHQNKAFAPSDDDTPARLKDRLGAGSPTKAGASGGATPQAVHQAQPPPPPPLPQQQQPSRGLRYGSPMLGATAPSAAASQTAATAAANEPTPASGAAGSHLLLVKQGRARSPTQQQQEQAFPATSGATALQGLHGSSPRRDAAQDCMPSRVPQVTPEGRACGHVRGSDVAGHPPLFGNRAQSPQPPPQPPVVPLRQLSLGGPGPMIPASSDGGGSDWEVDPAELRLEAMLGTGSTAEVFRGSWHGTDVAVKRLRRSGPMSTEFKREISVLLRLRHPNLVLFMGAAMQTPTPLIISEFCAGGTVFALLHQRRDLALPWPQRVKVAVDVAKGMTFLHWRQVVHRDLKSLNLLLESRVTTDMDVPLVKVSDFGLSRTWLSGAGEPQHQHQACMTSGAGTYHWMAPEVLDGQSYDEKVDVYSYGICLFEIIARRIPYEGSGLEPVSIAVAVSKGKRPDLRYVPKDCPADLRFTMECCWAHCATGRPGFDTILETLKLVSCP